MDKWLIWCNLNKEQDALEKAFTGKCVSIRGNTPYDKRLVDEKAWREGEMPIMISKPSVFGFGMNWQHCNKIAFVGLSDCYDEKTEVLTKRGWLSFGDVSLEDCIATVRPDTLRFEWQNPSKIVWEPYKGDMIHFIGQKNYDLLVTPNHKLFVNRSKVRFPGDKTNWHMMYAHELALTYKRQEFEMLSAPIECISDLPVKIDIPLPPMRINSRSVLINEIESKNMMVLVGWYVSEGYCRPLDSKEAGRIVICQTDVNPENRAEIIQLLNDIGLNVNDKTKDITGYSYQLASFLINEFGTNSHDKRLPSWIKELDKSLLVILRDTMLKGDGLHAKNGIPHAYRTSSKQLADDFQEICIKTGIKASVKVRLNANKDYPEYIAYDVSLSWKQNMPSVSKPPKIVGYDGYIGCVTVPNHLIIVRRNGIPVVSGNSFEEMYQAVRRCWRFGQTKPVDVYVITSESEGAVVKNIEKKEKKFQEMLSGMISATQEICSENLKATRSEQDDYKPEVKEGKNWKMYLGDCVTEMRKLESESVHYEIYSPPFKNIFVYSNSNKDLGNSRSMEEFEVHMGYVADECYRLLKPGRLMSFHCADIPAFKYKDGFAGLQDLPGHLIKVFEKAGFHYHSRVTIYKSPVTEMYRTKTQGLLYKQLKQDSSISRQGLADYVITMRKPGDNTEPIVHAEGSESEIPLPAWQKYADPVWMDIVQTDTLNNKSVREYEDEKHICPLQLGLIDRCLELWTNEGDTVLSPFAGIGSEGYTAIRKHRKFVGFELKKSYFDQACDYLSQAEKAGDLPRQVDLFKFADEEENKPKQVDLFKFEKVD